MSNIHLYARCVLVTGATRGIGFALVKQLIMLSDGVQRVFATYRSKDSLPEQPLFQLAKTNSKLTLVQMDVTNEDSIKLAVDIISKEVGQLGLHLLINNAGIGIEDTFYTVTKESMEQHFNTNTIGPLITIQMFLPLLRQGVNTNFSKGRSFKAAVVNVSSRCSCISSPRRNYFSYGCSKAALNMVSKCVSIELKQDNIVVVPFHPGSVMTDANKNGSMDPTDASLKILEIISELQLPKSGHFLSYNGSEMPW